MALYMQFQGPVSRKTFQICLITMCSFALVIEFFMPLHLTFSIRNVFNMNPTNTKNKDFIFMIWNDNSFIDNLTHNQYCEFIHKSLKHIPNCPWSNATPFAHPLLITATPRSGTVFSYQLFNSIGIQIVDDWHTPIRNVSDGQSSWLNAFNDDNLKKGERRLRRPAWKASNLDGARFTTVLHQIREPLHSITSMCTEPVTLIGYPKRENHWLITLNKMTHAFINRHTDNALDDATQTQVEQLMHFYYHWHMNLNKFGFPIFKVENLNADNQTAIDTLNWIIRISKLEHKVNNTALLRGRMNDDLYNILHVEKKVNARRHRITFTWDELFLMNESLAMKLWNLAKQYGYEYDWNYNVFNNVTRYNHTFSSDPKKLITCEPLNVGNATNTTAIEQQFNEWMAL
eukprot:581257_1